MKDLIQSIFGSYTPVTYVHEFAQWDVATEQYITMREEVIPAGLSGVDWTYVLGVLAFLIVLYCILRIIGGVISRV